MIPWFNKGRFNLLKAMQRCFKKQCKKQEDVKYELLESHDCGILAWGVDLQEFYSDKNRGMQDPRTERITKNIKDLMKKINASEVGGALVNKSDHVIISPTGWTESPSELLFQEMHDSLKDLM